MYLFDFRKTNKKQKHKGDPFLLRGQYDVSAVCCRRSAGKHCRPAVMRLHGQTVFPLARVLLFFGAVTAVCSFLSALGRMKTAFSCRNRLKKQYEEKLRLAERKLRKQASEQVQKARAELYQPAVQRHAG